MDKSFYDDHRGSKCPQRLFSKDVRKIKQSIDTAMDRYERSVTPDEIEALFMSDNPTLTTAQKQAFASLFSQIRKEQPMGSDIAQEVLSKLFQQVVGEDVANIGFDMVNGDASTLERLRNLLEQYSDDFIPNMNIEWEDMTEEQKLARGTHQLYRWNTLENMFVQNQLGLVAPETWALMESYIKIRKSECYLRDFMPNFNPAFSAYLRSVPDECAE